MNRIIEKIARRNGVSPKEVEKEMKIAIREGMKSRNANDFSRAFWDSISPNGEEPTIIQFIEACTKELV